MIRILSFASLLLAAGLGSASAPAQTTASDREKIREIVVYGTDPCPPSSEQEVIVCARRPEAERYRIPKTLREPEPTPQSESWAARAEALETVGKTGIQSCSPVGPGGASGCLEQLIKQAREERSAAAKGKSKVP
jgi:hypothetical protein